MANKNNLEEVYEKLQRHNQKFNEQFVKCCVCGSIYPFSVLNLSFGVFGVPFLYYAFSCLYHLYGQNGQNREFINSTEYIEFQKKFSILFSELKSMLEKIGIDTPPSIFSAYYYLVKNGFLSINHTFKTNNIGNYKFCNHSSILGGYGVCRNLSSFLTQLLRVFSYKSYSVEMLLENQVLCKITDEYFEEGQEVVPNENPVDFNHLGTLLSNGRKSYIMDAMNETFYLIRSNSVYPYQNDVETVITNLQKEYAFYKERKIPKVDSSEIADFEDIVKEYLQAREKCEDYKKTFETFYLEHKDLYKEIYSDSKDLTKGYEKILSL